MDGILNTENVLDMSSEVISILISSFNKETRGFWDPAGAVAGGMFLMLSGTSEPRGYIHKESY